VDGAGCQRAIAQVNSDVLIVGARCAGAPLAMLLARKGFSVSAVDRSTFPSDALSTHVIWPEGVAALQRWSVLDSILAADPARCTQWFASTPDGERRESLEAADAIAYAISLRRFKLDALLVRAAREAGAEIREHAVFDELLFDGDHVTGMLGHDAQSGERFEARASIVVGADGRDSSVARAVGAAEYNTVPSLTASYYTYTIDNETNRETLELHTRPPREFLVTPTDEGLTMVNLVIGSALISEFRESVNTNFLAAFDHCPRLANRLRMAQQVAPIRGTVSLPNFYRQSYGPGWALVGDAGYHRDPIRAQGIHDAFLDAEDLADAIEHGLLQADSMEAELHAHQVRRDNRTSASYERSLRAARFETADGLTR
jgi:flavin-dependent dehydrogenase